MVAGGTDLRGLLADDDVSAVAALPDLDLALGKDFGHLDVVEQRAVALLMVAFDLADQAEACGQLREALFFGGLGKAGVHIRPLVVLALGGGLQILRRVADALKLLEPELRVLLFVLGGLEEERGDLLKTLLFRNGREIGILVSGLRFAREGLHQIFLRLRAGIFCGFCHCDDILSSFICGPRPSSIIALRAGNGKEVCVPEFFVNSESRA